MALTSTAINRNMQMYGVADIDAFVVELTDSITYELTGGYMVVAGLMSDAQELLAVGDADRARRTLNIAKHVLFEIAEGRLVGSVERV
jgi:hypothetical protein